MTYEEVVEALKENFAAYSRARRAGESVRAVEIAKEGANLAAKELGVEAALAFFEEDGEEKRREFVEYAKKRNESRYH